MKLQAPRCAREQRTLPGPAPRPERQSGRSGSRRLVVPGCSSLDCLVDIFANEDGHVAIVR